MSILISFKDMDQNLRMRKPITLTQKLWLHRHTAFTYEYYLLFLWRQDTPLTTVILKVSISMGGMFYRFLPTKYNVRSRDQSNLRPSLDIIYLVCWQPSLIFYILYSHLKPFTNLFDIQYHYKDRGKHFYYILWKDISLLISIFVVSTKCSDP